MPSDLSAHVSAICVCICFVHIHVYISVTIAFDLESHELEEPEDVFG